MIPASLWVAENVHNEWAHLPGGFDPRIPAVHLMCQSSVSSTSFMNASYAFFFYPDDLKLLFVRMHPNATHTISMTIPRTKRSIALFEHADSIAVSLPVFVDGAGFSTTDSLVTIDSVRSTAGTSKTEVLAYGATNDSLLARNSRVNDIHRRAIESLRFKIRIRASRSEARTRL